MSIEKEMITEAVQTDFVRLEDRKKIERFYDKKLFDLYKELAIPQQVVVEVWEYRKETAEPGYAPLSGILEVWEKGGVWFTRFVDDKGSSGKTNDYRFDIRRNLKSMWEYKEFFQEVR